MCLGWAYVACVVPAWLCDACGHGHVMHVGMGM